MYRNRQETVKKNKMYERIILIHDRLHVLIRINTLIMFISGFRKKHNTVLTQANILLK